MSSESARTRTDRAGGVLAGVAPEAVRILAAVLFAALTAVAARVAVPLPGTVVPFTLQVVAVLLAGFLLGPRDGAASQALYLAAGAAGLPVFAAGGGAAYLAGPTGGYLLAFPVAAAIAGASASHGPGAWRLALGGAIAIAVIHTGGAGWLAILFDSGAATRSGVLPFLVGDALKLTLAVLVSSRLREPARRLLGSR